LRYFLQLPIAHFKTNPATTK